MTTVYDPATWRCHRAHTRERHVAPSPGMEVRASAGITQGECSRRARTRSHHGQGELCKEQSAEKRVTHFTTTGDWLFGSVKAKAQWYQTN